MARVFACLGQGKRESEWQVNKRECFDQTCFVTTRDICRGINGRSSRRYAFQQTNTKDNSLMPLAQELSVRRFSLCARWASLNP